MTEIQQDHLIGNYFLELAKLNATRGGGGPAEIVVGEEEEDAPTELNTINSSGGFQVVSTDKLSVQYTGVNLHGHDVGVAQSNRPAPVKRLMYYFEMYVKNAGTKGKVSIGFTNENFKMCRQPGWEPNSYGYHGDDGLLYRGQGKGETFGPTYTTGDTIGAGINYSSQELFFSKNGVVVGTVYKDVKEPLYPTVAVHSQNEEVSVNFGKDPFVFDIKAYEAQERAKRQNMIEKISVPQNVSYGIVRSYLLHYGYEETLNSFDLANKTSVPPVTLALENGFADQDSYALSQRKTLRQLIRTGNIDSTFDKLSQWYPQIVQDDKSTTCFLLHCQKFIELVRVKELEEAVKYGTNELERFFYMESFKELLKDCVALLAYEEPLQSSVGYLLEHKQREVVADAVNSMVLATNPNLNGSQQNCLHSNLEKLLRQLTACSLERRSLNGNQGEAFNLQRVLTTGKLGKK